ncbi:MAG: 2-amino-4-hydroxy-6-hydroxymethyldihydropteridine diphosphokinase [Steroidobacteraceae bacterium]
MADVVVEAVAVDAVPSKPVLWQPAYVALGSNLGDSRAMLERAIAAVSLLPHTRSCRRSALYRTVPFGPVEQGDFINAVLGVVTSLPVEDFFAALQHLESELGRVPRHERWGPREIDLDLLVYGCEQRESELLRLPHPGIPERDFVLYPLRDVAADLQIPGLGRVRDLAERVADRGMQRLG